MNKIFAIGALGLGLLVAGPSVAQQGRGMWGGMMGYPGMGMMGARSPEDMSALADAYIAGLRAGLKLNPQQEALWPPVEQALRNLAQLHIGHMRTMPQERGRAGDDPVGTLRAMADRMAQGADAMRRLADAAAPLYASLDEDQKSRLRLLTPGFAARGRGMMGGWGRGMWLGGDREGRDDR